MCVCVYCVLTDVLMSNEVVLLHDETQIHNSVLLMFPLKHHSPPAGTVRLCACVCFCVCVSVCVFLCVYVCVYGCVLDGVKEF